MRIAKCFKWEFWPLWITYSPVIIYLILRGICSGSFSHFLAVNPGLAFGGLVEYSKTAMLKYIPPKYLPANHYFPRPPAVREVEAIMETLAITYPVFLKPDTGERGYGVAKLANRNALEHYLRNAGGALILQACIDYAHEYGIMLVKDPESATVSITSVVVKEALSVVGDGMTTLAALVWQGERTRYHQKILQNLHRTNMEEIIPRGERRILMDIGNHSRGSTFRDGRRLISPELHAAFSPLMDCIPGFYLGRFDVKAEDPQALLAGNFTILEINGVNSEPAHIYGLNLFAAWAGLLRHWQAVSTISKMNMRKGCRPASCSQLLRAVWQRHRRQQKFPFRL